MAVTWADFIEQVYQAAERQGIERDSLDKVEVARLTCDPDEGVKVTIRRLTDKGIRNPIIFMIVS